MARFEVHPELERQTAAALIVYFIVFICLHLSVQLKRRRIQYISRYESPLRANRPSVETQMILSFLRQMLTALHRRLDSTLSTQVMAHRCEDEGSSAFGWQ